MNECCRVGCKAYLISVKSSTIDNLIKIIDEFIDENSIDVCFIRLHYQLHFLLFRYGSKCRHSVDRMAMIHGIIGLLLVSYIINNYFFLGRRYVHQSRKPIFISLSRSIRMMHYGTMMMICFVRNGNRFFTFFNIPFSV